MRESAGVFADAGDVGKTKSVVATNSDTKNVSLNLDLHMQ